MKFEPKLIDPSVLENIMASVTKPSSSGGINMNSIGCIIRNYWLGGVILIGVIICMYLGYRYHQNKQAKKLIDEVKIVMPEEKQVETFEQGKCTTGCSAPPEVQIEGDMSEIPNTIENMSRGASEPGVGYQEVEYGNQYYGMSITEPFSYQNNDFMAANMGSGGNFLTI